MSEEQGVYAVPNPAYMAVPKAAPVDKIKLASMMLEWYHKKCELDSLERVIESQVTRLGETVDVANIRCTFNSGRTKYEGWEAAGKNLFNFHRDDGSDEELVDFYYDLLNENSRTKTVVEQDWKTICEALGIEREVVSHGTPSATLKVMNE